MVCFTRCLLLLIVLPSLSQAEGSEKQPNSIAEGSGGDSKKDGDNGKAPDPPAGNNGAKGATQTPSPSEHQDPGSDQGTRSVPTPGDGKDVKAKTEEGKASDDGKNLPKTQNPDPTTPGSDGQGQSPAPPQGNSKTGDHQEKAQEPGDKPSPDGGGKQENHPPPAGKDPKDPAKPEDPAGEKDPKDPAKSGGDKTAEPGEDEGKQKPGIVSRGVSGDGDGSGDDAKKQPEHPGGPAKDTSSPGGSGGEGGDDADKHPDTKTMARSETLSQGTQNTPKKPALMRTHAMKREGQVSGTLEDPNHRKVKKHAAVGKVSRFRPGSQGDGDREGVDVPYKSLGDRKRLDAGENYEVVFDKDLEKKKCKDYITILGYESGAAASVKATFVAPCQERSIYYSDNTILVGSVDDNFAAYGHTGMPERLVIVQDSRCRINTYPAELVKSFVFVMTKEDCHKVKEILTALLSQFLLPLQQRAQDEVKEQQEALEKLITPLPNSLEDNSDSFHGEVYQPIEKKRYENDNGVYKIEYSNGGIGQLCKDQIKIQGVSGEETSVVDDLFTPQCRDKRMIYFSHHMFLVGGTDDTFLVFGLKHIPERLFVIRKGKCEVDTYTDEGKHIYRLDENDCIIARESFGYLIKQFNLRPEKRIQDVMSAEQQEVIKVMASAANGEKVDPKTGMLRGEVPEDATRTQRAVFAVTNVVTDTKEAVVQAVSNVVFHPVDTVVKASVAVSNVVLHPVDTVVQASIAVRDAAVSCFNGIMSIPKFLMWWK